MTIIGHRKNLDFFEAALENKALAHAYCFVGPDQVGKRTVARHIAALALKTEPEKLLAHPDFFYMEREVDEKKDRLKKDISVAQARTVIDFLQNRSWLGGVKAVIIDEAETINEEAANALLKILEEVTNGLIFLLTTNEKKLPATIRSRCQTVEFTLVAPDEISRGLSERGYAPEIAGQAVQSAWGRPGKAISLLQEDGALEAYLQETGRWKKIISSPFYEKLAIVEDLFGDKEDAIRGRDRLRKIIDLWIMLWRDELLAKSGENGAGKIAGLIDTLSETKLLLGQNIHPRLLIEQVLLKI